MSDKTKMQQTQPANAGANRYFNEYVNGIGYLNSIREFGAQGPPTRFAAQVSVIQGPADNVHYEQHDLIISSDAVLAVVKNHRELIENEAANVLIRFNMTNPRAKVFVHKKGKRAGETDTVISGFLTRILTVKIDGELVYEDERTFEDSRQAVNG